MSRRPRPGWLIALCAVVLSASTWMPWLTSKGGWANAIGGVHGSLPHTRGFGAGQLIVLLASALLVAGAMVGRGLSGRVASVAALIISLLVVGTLLLYYQRNVGAQVKPEYGLYVGAVAAGAAVLCALWAFAEAILGGGRR
ncbi:hypothetical protein [Mycobacterium vicinigordonae]|uniref:Transmembrane protein n=1 Tax=Mycobacterium vicinigordonae TaxID=1719132 RepID=A0A7D6E060_9MYCO|nr:hypothetical protein [Mycobacterium vicinigordonae]QLL06681.1 hypothetical protein H0P51_23680 [Mycobacterium vicinigordonae]